MGATFSRYDRNFQKVYKESGQRLCFIHKCSYVLEFRLTPVHSRFAARRTGTYDVVTAWKALLEAKDLKEILSNRRLEEARREINFEVEKHTHTPPKFSKDGKIAVLKINTQAQVHPVIATRWVWLLHQYQPRKTSLTRILRLVI
jgi:hypothetical protein